MIRQGMTVQQLIDALNAIDDKSRLVAVPEKSLGSIEGVRVVNPLVVGGFAGRYSFEETAIVLLCE